MVLHVLQENEDVINVANHETIQAGGCKIRWLIFYVAIQFFAEWRAFTCY
jgi:hypothetical protein